jgi:hypothetical protein
VPDDDTAATIRSGPRWDAVDAGVAMAAEALTAPLTDDELAGGWTDQLREGILDDVRRVRDELMATPDTAAVLEAWSGVEDVDVEGDTLRLDAIMEVDLVLGDLDRAEHALDATDGLLGDLAATTTAEDRDAGFTEEVRDELLGLATGLRSTLAAGDYLSVAQMDDWADALRALGFLRVVARRGVDDDALGRGFNARKIEQFPPGRRFEQLAIYDGELFGVAMPDVLADEQLADGQLVDAPAGDEPTGDEQADDEQAADEQADDDQTGNERTSSA